jgi:hypothetical protein
MPSLRDQFRHFYTPDEDDIETAMKTGLVVPDANVLLNFYRFQRTARDELFEALEKLGDRLWIPHQVGLEFHQTRLAVMAEQDDYFDSAGELIVARMKDYLNAVRSFAKRIGLPEFTLNQLEAGIREAHAAVVTGKFWVDAEKDAISPDDHASDPVFARVDALFANENSVGEPMEPQELQDARTEAERRGTEKIPPGYRDKNKVKGDSAGDYLAWRQLMTEAASRKLPVVFITDDTKDDWYQREQGRTIGARRELREEMTRVAGVPLLIMTTDSFLIHAEKYLNATVSDETVEQAKELPGQSQPVAARKPTAEEWVSLGPKIISSMSDAVLGRLHTGESIDTNTYFALGLLSAQLGEEEAMRVVGREINAAMASGTLPTERGHEAIEAVTTFAMMRRAEEPAAED